MSKINANNDISVYRGETAAIDFKISQRTDYYVPFLISSERVNPMVCITIGSTRRENNNIVSKQLWLELTDVPKFFLTRVEDMGMLPEAAWDNDGMVPYMTAGIMYQFTTTEEVEAGNSQLHFAYLNPEDETEVLTDDYDFTVVMSLDETITLDMTNTDYFYQIELMDTVPMSTELETIFSDSTLRAKMSDAFNTAWASSPTTAVTEYQAACVALINKVWPNYWGYRILDPATSIVAKVSNIQMLQPPRRFVVQSVVK
jgi:hypothetical protein